MAYNGRRGPNVSQYIANLNAIPTAQELHNSAQDTFLDDDLAMFTNTTFFDFDSHEDLQGDGFDGLGGQIVGEEGLDLKADLDFSSGMFGLIYSWFIWLCFYLFMSLFIVEGRGTRWYRRRYHHLDTIDTSTSTNGSPNLYNPAASPCKFHLLNQDRIISLVDKRSHVHHLQGFELQSRDKGILTCATMDSDELRLHSPIRAQNCDISRVLTQTHNHRTSVCQIQHEHTAL